MHHTYPHPYHHHLFLLFLGSCLCLCGETTPSQRLTLTSRGAHGGLTRLMIHFLTFPLQLMILVPTFVSLLLVSFPPHPLCAATDTCAWLALSSYEKPASPSSVLCPGVLTKTLLLHHHCAELYNLSPDAVLPLSSFIPAVFGIEHMPMGLVQASLLNRPHADLSIPLYSLLSHPSALYLFFCQLPPYQLTRQGNHV